MKLWKYLPAAILSLGMLTLMGCDTGDQQQQPGAPATEPAPQQQPAPPDREREIERQRELERQRDMQRQPPPPTDPDLQRQPPPPTDPDLQRQQDEEMQREPGMRPEDERSPGATGGAGA